MAYKNREDALKYARNWYKKNKETEIKKKKERLTKIKKWYNDYKSTLKCERCPENHVICLDFHHTQDDKEMAISKIICNGWCIESIKKEMDKCIVLCSNCHRKEHFS